MSKLLAMLIGVCVAWSLGATPANASGRFHAYVGGSATGAGHDFVVGDGLNLVFQDDARANTKYRVCWSRGTGRRCWNRTTGRAGKRSSIFTAAPQNVGNYKTTWYVGGKAVASWSFFNGIGD